MLTAFSTLQLMHQRALQLMRYIVCVQLSHRKDSRLAMISICLPTA